MAIARINNLHKTGILCAGAVLAADLMTKDYFQSLLFSPPRQIAITPFFNLTPVWNKGVSFGLFADSSVASAYFLAGLAAFISAIVIVWLWRAADRITAVGCGMILGGGIGNIYDRIKFGAVRDFFDFYIGNYHWPAFNIADSAVVCGVLFLLFSTAKPSVKLPSE